MRLWRTAVQVGKVAWHCRIHVHGEVCLDIVEGACPNRSGGGEEGRCDHGTENSRAPRRRAAGSPPSPMALQSRYWTASAPLRLDQRIHRSPVRALRPVLTVARDHRRPARGVGPAAVGDDRHVCRAACSPGRSASARTRRRPCTATAFIATMTASQLLNAWVVAALGQRVAFPARLACSSSAPSAPRRSPSTRGSWGACCRARRPASSSRWSW